MSEELKHPDTGKQSRAKLVNFTVASLSQTSGYDENVLYVCCWTDLLSLLTKQLRDLNLALCKKINKSMNKII